MDRRIVTAVFIVAMILVPFIGAYYSPAISFKPNFSAINPLAARQDAFIVFMVPKINYSNDEILQTRTQIQNILNLWQKNQSLSYSDRSWLREIAYVYQIPDFDLNNPDDTKELLTRVDEVPSSLVLAQAANESAWGASRLATQADNFFGQHCSVPGCGLVPLDRTSGDTFEVQKFNNVQNSIDNYLYNLNTNPSYATFRTMRAELRSHGEPLAGFRLAPFLVNYSTLGEQYVLMISSIIVNHNLMQYDALSEEVSS